MVDIPHTHNCWKTMNRKTIFSYSHLHKQLLQTFEGQNKARFLGYVIQQNEFRMINLIIKTKNYLHFPNYLEILHC
jgi:hypothetical protein